MPILLPRIRKFLQEMDMPVAGCRVLVGVSGGLDSMVLVHILNELGYEVRAVHINYGLRGSESEGDAALVETWLERWQIPLTIYKEDPQTLAMSTGQSIQMAARDIRYRIFEAEMEKNAISYCALAHHQDDQVETLVLSLLRGGRGELIQGIPVSRGTYFRPLWFAWKSEILAYALEVGIEWREDSSNKTNKYPRNIVRNEVLPAMEKIHPQPHKRISEWGAWTLRQQGLIQKLANQVVTHYIYRTGHRTELRLAELQDQYGEDLPSLLMPVLQSEGFSASEAAEVVGLIATKSGAIFEGSIMFVIRTHKGLEWMPHQYLPDADAKLVIESTENLFLEGMKFGSQRIHIKAITEGEMAAESLGPDEYLMDLAKVEFPLRIRRWQAGDSMQPLGMASTKKLKEIFIDAKRSLFDKMEAIVFEDAQQIICLSGYRISERVAVGPSTRELLYLKMEY